MPNLNHGEYGDTIRVNMGEDVSTNTALTITFQPKYGDPVTRTQADGVAVGSADVEVDDETYQADEYLEYTLQDGDLDAFIGQWRMRGEVQISATNRVIGDFRYFTVLP